MTPQDDFHDAVLVDLNFNWLDRSLTCALRRVSENPITEHAIFFDVRKIMITSSHPWGRSSSVNSLRKILLDDGLNFIIEMQSGDSIEIHASKMTFG